MIVFLLCVLVGIFFPYPTVTITATGFDPVNISQQERDILLVFKNDLSLPVTLCLGTNHQCNPHLSDPSELASPGLTIQPRSSKHVTFSGIEESSITIVSLKLPHDNLYLSYDVIPVF
jgi:hypothetical protein